MTQIILPNSGHPQNGEDLDADVLRGQIQALLGYLQAFPGDNINAGTILATALSADANPDLWRQDSFPSYISSGGLPSGFTGFQLSIPAITSAYFASTGNRLPSLSGGTYTVNPSQDTYFTLNPNGAIDTPQGVANNASAPSVPSGSQPLFRAISDGSAIQRIDDLRVRAPFGRQAGIDASDLNPIIGGTWTDIPSSSFLIWVEKASYFAYTLTTEFQINTNDTALLQLNLDGALVGRQAILINPGSGLHASAARLSRVPLSAGYHLIKLQGRCNNSSNCVAYSPSVWGTLVTQ